MKEVGGQSGDEHEKLRSRFQHRENESIRDLLTKVVQNIHKVNRICWNNRIYNDYLCEMKDTF